MQDEEEKQLRMQILQGSQKEGKGKNKGKGKDAPEQENKPKQNKPKPKPQQKQPKPKEDAGEDDDDEGEEEKATAVNAELDMLDSLTGLPVAEDELLFAVPVVAPYNTMLAYKYKVKVTPGTGKKGKATKTALAMFMADKATSQREKELLKSVKVTIFKYEIIVQLYNLDCFASRTSIWQEIFRPAR